MAAMLAATALDVATTCYFLSRGLGVEMNRVLAPLAQRSLIWVPVYLFARPLFVPTMPGVVRESFAAHYLAVGLLISINNLCGILLGTYVLVDNLGLAAVQGGGMLIAATTFVARLSARKTTWKLTAQCIGLALVWLAAFVVIEGGFSLLGRLL
jgi:hypothetical protein